MGIAKIGDIEVGVTRTNNGASFKFNSNPQDARNTLAQLLERQGASVQRPVVMSPDDPIYSTQDELPYSVTIAALNPNNTFLAQVRATFLEATANKNPVRKPIRPAGINTYAFKDSEGQVFIEDQSGQLHGIFKKSGVTVGALVDNKFTVDISQEPSAPAGKRLWQSVRDAFPEIGTPSFP